MNGKWPNSANKQKNKFFSIKKKGAHILNLSEKSDNSFVFLLFI